MKKILLTLLFLSIITSAYAKVKVVTAYPYIADLVQKIGGNAVDVKALAPGNWDPHTVVPRPSYIAKVRNADLLIINGAELEIGWMPPIIRESKNNRIQPGSAGFLDLSTLVHLMDKPDTISRALGDIHPSGNPHFMLDPDNVPFLAHGIFKKLSALDSANSALYKNNYEKFINKWVAAVEKWKNSLSNMKGVKVVQYHKLFNSFFKKFGIIVSAELEPLPGIPPASGQMKKIIGIVNDESVRLVVTDVYHPVDAARFVAEKTNTRLVVLPHDVHAIDGIDDIFGLYDEIVRRVAN